MRKVLLEMVGVRSETEWDRRLEARRRARKRAYQRAWYAKRAKHPEAHRT
jgi:chloramphenicol 3-O-phosphotransferase